jgi:hypothetical protein
LTTALIGIQVRHLVQVPANKRDMEAPVIVVRALTLLSFIKPYPPIIAVPHRQTPAAVFASPRLTPEASLVIVLDHTGLYQSSVEGEGETFR